MAAWHAMHEMIYNADELHVAPFGGKQIECEAGIQGGRRGCDQAGEGLQGMQGKIHLISLHGVSLHAQHTMQPLDQQFVVGGSKNKSSWPQNLAEARPQKNMEMN